VSVDITQEGREGESLGASAEMSANLVLAYGLEVSDLTLGVCLEHGRRAAASVGGEPTNRLSLAI